jgi:TonB family protein
MKIKIFFTAFIFCLTGLFAQPKEVLKFQVENQSEFIEVDKPPELLSQIKPEQNQLSFLSGIQATFYLKLLIEEDGNVEKIELLNHVKDEIDPMTLTAAKGAKYSPAILGNKPIKVWAVLLISFNEKVINARIMNYSELPLVDSIIKEEPGQFIEIGKMSEMTEAVEPLYPEEAKKNNIIDDVLVKVLLDKEGNPRNAVAIQSNSDIFNSYAVDAAMKSKFTPAMDRKEKIAIWIVIPYKFDYGSKEN